MRTTLRLSAWFAAALATAILFGARGADAHEYFVGKNVPLPVGQDGRRRIALSVGETITLTVKNSDGQSCLANIAAAGFSTSAISVTSPQPAGAVQTRVFQITGRRQDITEIDVTVQGVDPCTEDSHNPIVVEVLPDPAELLALFGGAGRNEAKLLKVSLKTALSELGDYSASVTDGFADGSVSPDVAANSLVEAWYQAWAYGFFAGSSVQQNLSNYGNSLLLTDGWPECTSPLRFADGMRGPFDTLRSGVRVQLDGYRSKLAKQIDSDIAAYGKIGLKYGIGFTSSYELGSYPDVDVTGPARSPSPVDPGAPLYVGYIGGVTWSTESDSMTCVAVGGLGRIDSGPVRVDLWDGDVIVGSQVVPLEGAGIWDAMFDDVVAGKTYRAAVKYEPGDAGHSTRDVFVSRLRLNF